MSKNIYTGKLRKLPFKFFNKEDMLEHIKRILTPEEYTKYVRHFSEDILDYFELDKDSGYIVVDLMLFEVLEIEDLTDSVEFCKVEKGSAEVITFTSKFTSSDTCLEDMLAEEISTQRLFRDPRGKQ